jgi:23S rRNA (adenine1618-N6)-methyltransferase
VWSRSARRKSARSDEESGEDDEDEMAFGFKIRVWEGRGGEEGESGGEGSDGKGSAAVQVLVRWLKGHDSVLFESFCGMVKRKVGA